jgi:hypothetical protein
MSNQHTGLRLALLAGLSLLALPALADDTRFEIQLGRSYSNSVGTNTLFLESVFNPQPIGASRWTWAPDVSFGYLNGRDLQHYDGDRYTTKDDIWLGAAGVRVHYGDASDWYQPLFFSFQPALHTGRTLALSSVYEFVSTLGWQGKHFSVQVRHISNGGFHEPNRGETMGLIGFAF